jgi:hypothetical protein
VQLHRTLKIHDSESTESKRIMSDVKICLAKPINRDELTCPNNDTREVKIADSVKEKSLEAKFENFRQGIKENVKDIVEEREIEEMMAFFGIYWDAVAFELRRGCNDKQRRGQQ